MSIVTARKLTVILSIFLVVGCSKKVAKIESFPVVVASPAPTPKPTPKIIEPVQAPIIAPVVPPTIYFDWDKSELLPSEMEKLAQFIVYNKHCSIEGHADESGSAEYNLALGDRRAQVVADYLRNAGASIGDVISYGEERPVHICGCKHPENRRVEIKAE